MSTSTETIEQLANREYKYGFYTDVESETIPPTPTASATPINPVSASTMNPLCTTFRRLFADPTE